MSHRSRVLGLSLLCLIEASCGGGGDGGGAGPTTPTPSPVDNTPKVTSIAFVSGDGQTARRGTATTTNASVVVKSQSGAPMAGIPVTFSVTGGGTIATTSATTAADGTASPGVWTLGSTAGPNVLKAVATGGSNPSAQITATGRNPLWTVMVYLAGDNSIAGAGASNIGEMEDTTGSQEVQFIVQAEFNAAALAQRGCTSSCFFRPNFNTFRYLVPYSPEKQPHGPGEASATDIGNRNMTDPLQLREFIQYAKATAPAEHYITILWGHGGGHAGFISDETSAPGTMMSASDLATAFSGVGAIDILAFDMSLMGSYEILSKVNGIASLVFFSEDTQPGAGYPYDLITGAMAKNPPTTARAAADILAAAYLAKYGNSRYSMTVSWYDMTGFAAFESSLGSLAANLQANVGTFGTGLTAAAAGAQRFENPVMKDFGSLMDSLRVQLTNTTTRAAIDAAKTAHSAFLVKSQQHTGTGQGARNVGRATGLSILMPSLVGNDRMPSSGSENLASYQTQFGSKSWGQFINSWLAGKTETSYTDLGTNRLEAYLVWDSAAVAKQADVDLFVLEPDGTLHGPALGTISPNGRFTSDSYQHPPTYYEGLQLQRFVQPGTYKLYAYYWLDFPSLQFPYNLAYRNSPSAAFTNLFSGTLPKLSGTTKFADDPAATYTKVDAKSYTDFRTVAVVTVPGSLTAASITSQAVVSAEVGGDSGPNLTAQQVRMLQSIGKMKRLRGSAPRPAVRLSVPRLPYAF